MTDRTGLRVAPLVEAATANSAGPIRTCVGCRHTDSWSALLRVVAVSREQSQHGVAVVPDPRHRLPGRGAWLHPSTECFEQAVRRKAFGRALRLRVAADVSAVTAYLEAHEQQPTVEVDDTEGGLDADENPMSTQR